MNTPRPTEATLAPAANAPDAAATDGQPATDWAPANANASDTNSDTNTDLSPQDLDELDDILAHLSQCNDGGPSWEFLEGYMAGLLCCRRRIEADEYLPAVLANPNSGYFGPKLFQSPAQHQRFMQLWQRRWEQVQGALDAPVDALDDPLAYAPELIDLRAVVQSLSPEERAEFCADLGEEQHIPAFAQLWAMGFMAVVQTWPEEWQPPRDRELAEWMEEALECIEALSGDDLDPPTLSPLDDNAPPSVSQQRMDAYGAALWAAYDLREIALTLGPRVPPQRKTEQPGRNDPCHCGSGKKFKKCHGA